MIMFTKGRTVTLLAIAIASSLIAVSSGLLGSAFAAKKGRDNPILTNTITDPNGTDNSRSPKSQSIKTGDSSSNTGSANSISGKHLKSLSKCQSDAAKDGDLTLTEVKNCYSQVFNHEVQGQGTDQPSSSTSNDQSLGGQGLQKSGSLNGANVEAMREGFPF